MNASDDAPDMPRYEESAGVLVVRLPAPRPAAEQSSKGCAIAMAVLAAVIAIPAILMALADVANDKPIEPARWISYLCVALFAGWILWHASREAERARQPLAAPEPSLLRIDDSGFRVERAGPHRGTDYSWEMSEIADVRLCRAAPDQVFTGLGALLGHALHERRPLRVSVMSPAGDVVDVMVDSPGNFSVEQLEAAVRTRLGLPGATPVS